MLYILEGDRKVSVFLDGEGVVVTTKFERLVDLGGQLLWMDYSSTGDMPPEMVRLTLCS